MKAYEVSGIKVQEGIQVGEKKLASGTVIKFNLIALQTGKEVGERVYDVATVPTRSGKTKLLEIKPTEEDQDVVIVLHGYCRYRGRNHVSFNEHVEEIASSSGKASQRGSLGYWTSHVFVCNPGARIKHVASGRHANANDTQYISYDGESVKLVTQEELDLT